MTFLTKENGYTNSCYANRKYGKTRFANKRQKAKTQIQEENAQNRNKDLEPKTSNKSRLAVPYANRPNGATQKDIATKTNEP